MVLVEARQGILCHLKVILNLSRVDGEAWDSEKPQ